ncbi:hypothetical protein PENSPDRAFT_759326 [Peniophora sp. CONT]|nr:hypothetical protein PENSPDRAFT_759326 [Peniophora sp. CONT]
MSSNACDSRLDTALALTKRIANEQAFPLLLETILTTIFTVLLVSFVSRRWSSKSRSSRWTLYLAVFMYTLTVLIWALDVRVLSENMYQAMAWELSPTKDRAEEESVLRVLNRVQMAQNCVTQTIYIMTDVITLWRVYIVFQKPRWFLGVLVFTGLIETGISVGVIYLAATTSNVSPSHMLLVYRALYLTVSASTTTCQVFCSSMIGYKAWSHWQEISEFINFSASPRLVRTLVLIFELGLVYSALWIWFTLIWAYNTAWDETAFYWSGYYMITLSAMYPTLVIMLVAAHGSIVERSFQLPSRASALDINVPVVRTMRDEGFAPLSRQTSHRSHSDPGTDYDKNGEVKHLGATTGGELLLEMTFTSTLEDRPHRELIV